MDQEQVNASFEAIQNPILRLMIYFLVSVVGTMAGAIVYLYRERQELQKEMIAQNRENIQALNNAADAIERMAEKLHT